MQIAVHVHSDYSYDGELSLGELRAHFLQQGVSAALMAEHAEDFDTESYARYCESLADASGDGFLFVPGLEFRCIEGPHIVALGLHQHIPCEPGVRECLAQIRMQKAIAVLAHPSYPPPALLVELAPLFDAVETWNVPSEGGILPDPRKFSIYREMREQNPRLLAIGALDFHRTAGYKRVLLRMDPEPDWTGIRQNLLKGSYIIEAGRWTYVSQPRFRFLENLFFRFGHFGFRSARYCRNFLLRVHKSSARWGCTHGKK